MICSNTVWYRHDYPPQWPVIVSSVGTSREATIRHRKLLESRWRTGLVYGIGVRDRCTGSVYRIGVRDWCTGSVYGIGVRDWCTGLVFERTDLSGKSGLKTWYGKRVTEPPHPVTVWSENVIWKRDLMGYVYRPTSNWKRLQSSPDEDTRLSHYQPVTL